MTFKQPPPRGCVLKHLPIASCLGMSSGSRLRAAVC